MSELYVSCSSIVAYEGGVVLVEETKPHIAGLLSLPGGRTEDREPLAYAAVREGEEETG